MDIIQIPFAKHIGIKQKEEGRLELEPTKVVQNHIQTIHASAQFALAETQTGLYLQLSFPELEGKVVGLLRGSTVKYKAPATTGIIAKATLSDERREKFLVQLERRGRATIAIDVELYDTEGTVTMMGTFTWFIQTLS